MDTNGNLNRPAFPDPRLSPRRSGPRSPRRRAAKGEFDPANVRQPLAGCRCSRKPSGNGPVRRQSADALEGLYAAFAPYPARGSGHMGPDAPIVAERLKRAAWRTWPETEQLSIKSAFGAAWSWSVDQHPGARATAGDWLCGIAALEEPIDWVTGTERLAAFLQGMEVVPEDDRWCIDQALEAAGFRQRH
jgi:hypothetical protein